MNFVPEPSGTLSAMCTRHLSKFVCYLHRNPPEPHQASAPEPSGTLSAICTGTLRKLIIHLHRNPPGPYELSPELHYREGSGTLRNLLRNLVLQLHRIAPELFWAKDPIASFAVGEKSTFGLLLYPLAKWCWDGSAPRSKPTLSYCSVHFPASSFATFDDTDLMKWRVSNPIYYTLVMNRNDIDFFTTIW